MPWVVVRNSESERARAESEAREIRDLTEEIGRTKRELTRLHEEDTIEKVRALTAPSSDGDVLRIRSDDPALEEAEALKGQLEQARAELIRSQVRRAIGPPEDDPRITPGARRKRPLSASEVRRAHREGKT